MAYTAIDNPELYFQIKTYTGTGTSTAFTLDGDEDMQPDLVWLKYRNASDSHALYDSVRGTQEILQSDRNNAEITQTNGLSAFGSNGFTIGDNGQINTSSGLYVAWCWKESATAGFDIVSYTGNGTDDTDISHNLSAVPKVIIVKNRDANDAWQVYHGANTSAPETDYMVLNTATATADAADRWSDEAPTSSVFTLGDGAEVNTNTENYIAYCFAEKQGFSKFGTLDSINSDNGAFSYCGFKPALVILKSIDTTDGWSNWLMFDNKRNTYNLTDLELAANATAAENDGGANYAQIDLLSNGFKIRRDANWGYGKADETLIFMAFAEAPFVNSNGVPCNAR
jgi:hypothetical protein